MIVIVCGGRRYNDKNALFEKMDALHSHRFITMVVQGGANGADYLAKLWANERGVHCATVEPQWSRYGNKAGPLRNAAMLLFKPAYVIAFPGGSGTADMVKRALEARLFVWEPIVGDNHGNGG